MSSFSYLIEVKTEYKLLEKKFIKTRENLGKWENRIFLARQANELNLQKKAEGQVKILRNDVEYLTNQLLGLKQEVEKALKIDQKQPRQLSIDPKKLLADMNNLIGNADTMNLDNDIIRIKADNELEELKKKIKS